jgi:hypothetical protein
VGVSLIAAGCSTVLGLEDHEPFPKDASVSDAGQDAGPDALQDAAVDAPADASADVTDANTEDSSPPERVTQDLIALYTFDEGSGDQVMDVSGVDPPLDLTIAPAFLTTWHPGYLEIKGNSLAASPGPATKIYDACTASKEITVEAWVAPATTGQQGPARIVTMSGDTSARNFTLAQDNDQYFMRLRTTNTDSNGEPPTLTLPGTLTTELTHVVFTRAADGSTTIYLNGSIQGSSKIDGTFGPWNDTFRFGLANEMTKDRTWLGSLHLVAIYSRALTKDEAAQNFAAGAD